MRELLALADRETLRLWENLTLGYTETLGHPLLREQITDLYHQVVPTNVLCFAGAEEAVYIFMRVLLRPGDHVIVTFPGYQSLYAVAESVGAEVTYLPLHLQSAGGSVEWRIDLNELRSVIRSNTRLMVVNFPHNPTGALPTHAEWDELVEIARQAGCYLFSDEVYRLLEYPSEDRLAAAVDCYEKAVSLGVMSKPFGLAGLRLGWLACRDAELLQGLAEYKDYTTICNSAPSEILALIALRERKRVLERSLTIVKSNLAWVDEFMKEHHRWLQWIPPRAGSIAFPRWLGEQPVEQFCEALVESEGVLLLPATVYQYAGSHFRFGLGRKNLPEALEHFDRFLSKLV